MAIKTYSKRNAASAAQTNTNLNASRVPPPVSYFSTQGETERTPPWRRRANKVASIDFSDSDDEQNRVVNEDSTFFVAMREFRKGMQIDINELSIWLATWVKDGANEKVVRRCIPVEWPLNRQMRFAAWTQLLGLNCRWEGGYLWVEADRPSLNRIVRVYAEKDTAREASPLPAAPPRRTTTGRLKEVELNFGALQLDDVRSAVKLSSRNSILKDDEETENDEHAMDNQEDDGDGEHTMNARNRPRKWQHQQVSVSPTNAGKLRPSDRRSSLGPLAAEKRLSRASLIDVRRSSLAIGRRTTLVAIKEDTAPIKPSKRVSDLVPTSWDKIQTGEASLVLKQVLSFLGPSDLLSRVALVSKRWLVAATSAANLLAAENTGMFLSSTKFFDAFTQAEFIAEGAYKSVFKVFNPYRKEWDAVSVMDREEIARVGDVNIVDQEVNVSLLLSDLVVSNVCPNFILTRRVFRLRESPPWSGASKPVKRKQKSTSFQYIQMELCELGDLESYMKTLVGGALSIDQARSVVFQMIYALYAARRSVKLRHYDIKLLNFFAKSTSVTAEGMLYMIGLDAHCRIEPSGLMTKLADYGTSDVDPGALGKPVDVRHFTTLENTPPEFMLFSDAVQSFAADTFQLGLSVLHVLTGALPYEEILESVKCPIALMDAISDVWESSGKEFETLRCVLRDDDDNVLYHTLYRFVVLFGLSHEREDLPKTKRNRYDPSNSRVFRAIRSVLGLNVEDSALDTAGKSLKAKNIRQARKQFASDRAKFSLNNGSHHLITRAKERGQQLGIWEDVLQSFVNFDPEKRLLMREALRSKAFIQWVSVMPLSNQEMRQAFGVELQAMDEETEVAF